MFVKKIPRWKIKRFIKGCIRTILFFVIISSFFIISCSASAYPYSYKDFQSFVGDGYVTYLLRHPNGNILKQGEFDSEDNLDTMRLSTGIEEVTYAFDSVRLSVFDSSNVNQDFKPFDSVILSQRILCIVGDEHLRSEDWMDKFTVDINYTTTDYVNGTLSLRGSDVLKSYAYYPKYDNISDFNVYEFVVDFQSSFPNVSGTVTSIDYHFYDIVARSYTFTVCPSSKLVPNPTSNIVEHLSMIYYVGDSANAPIYEVADDSSLDELDMTEGELFDIYNGGFTQFRDFYQSLDPTKQWDFFSYVKGASAIFTIFWNNAINPHFGTLIDFLLIAGIFGFILSIAGSIISKVKR